MPSISRPYLPSERSPIARVAGAQDRAAAKAITALMPIHANMGTGDKFGISAARNHLPFDKYYKKCTLN